MNVDFDATEMESVRTRLEEARAAKTELPRLHDETSQWQHRRNTLELCLERVAEQLAGLESPGLLGALFGVSRSKLEATREQFAELEKQVAECDQSLLDLSSQIIECEQRAADIDQLESAYKNLCQAKRAGLRSGESQQSTALRQLDQRLGDCRRNHHEVEKAIQTAEHLKERLSSMTRALGRARMNRIGRVPGAAIINTITSQKATGSIDRVREGFDRLLREIGRIELRDGDFTDGEIARLTPVLSGGLADLASHSTGSMIWDVGVAGPFLDQVQEILGHLKEKRETLQSQIRTLETEQGHLIESA